MYFDPSDEQLSVRDGVRKLARTELAPVCLRRAQSDEFPWELHRRVVTKWYGPKQAGEAVHDCLLLHGNYGYSCELPSEQRMRDVLAVEIADGTAPNPLNGWP